MLLGRRVMGGGVVMSYSSGHDVNYDERTWVHGWWNCHV